MSLKPTQLLYNGECNEEMEKIPDKSVDLIFADLPYAQTSCAWDVMIDHEAMWKHFMRIKKLNTPLFFTTTTKFGVELIKSAPKQCPFRYDIVWIKSAPCGFLSARKMPMRKHEMIYVFYEKLPFYDLSSHTHKFKKTTPRKNDNTIYGMKAHADGKEGSYTPPLPTSVQHGTSGQETIYGDLPKTGATKEAHSQQYSPALPTSILKEGVKIRRDDEINHGATYGGGHSVTRWTADKSITKGNAQVYEPPLPTSIVKEDIKRDIYGRNHKEDEGLRGSWTPPLPTSILPILKDDPVYLTKSKETTIYGDLTFVNYKARKNGESAYEPPLPTSLLKEGVTMRTDQIHEGQIYNNGKELWTEQYTASKEITEGNSQKYKPPLPTSIVKEDVYNYGARVASGKLTRTLPNQWATPLPNSVIHDDDEICPICSEYPDSCLEIKSKKGKHSTQKPIELMKWVFKYYSKEGDTILDPTMGSGSTGVACKLMNRNFIGIEKDNDIFKVAEERIGCEGNFLKD